MANGDRSEESWLELLPIHLDDEASWLYDGQTEEIKGSWALLTKGLTTPCNSILYVRSFFKNGTDLTELVI
jgi:hypothetical protein